MAAVNRLQLLIKLSSQRRRGRLADVELISCYAQQKLTPAE
jgi:hypothetical protein